MLVLGIETSCDETAFGLVEDGRLLAESVASQADVHALFGGVVPELASREHYRILGPLFDEFICRAGIKAEDLSGIAVARGPGLLGSLLVGVASSFFIHNSSLAPEWRLLIITGFLGGLTTFSTFTAEIGTLLQEQRLAMAAGAITLHVCGSLICFFMGLGAVSLLKSLFR